MFVLTAALLSPQAAAVDTEFAGTEAPPEEVVEAPESTVIAELGGTFASGNAVYYAVNGGVTASHKWDKNKLSAAAGINIGAAVADTDADGLLNDAERAEGFSQNVERYFGEGRYDRFLSDKDSLYLLAGAFKDPFAGYDLRAHEQIGYSRTLVANDSTNLVTELGFDVAQENYVEGVDPNTQVIYAARLLLGLTHKFNDNVAFTDTFEVYENVIDLEDLRILNTASLSSTIATNLSLKLSHSLIFDNVPVEGFENLDQTTMVTLVATLL